MDEHYHPHTLEANVQHYWQEHHSFQVTEEIDKEKFYCLAMFPYPSGELHMGHIRVYTISDVIARYQHMLGKNVLQPMGWDAFGLPAENAALKNNTLPAEWTQKNIHTMREQMGRMGFAYDWSREIATCDPDYYRWEQWFFLTLYEKGLVYKKNAEVNWDPVDQTVLANEQVINGRGWRSNALIERRTIAQWFLKITHYAEELLNDIEQLTEWPHSVRTMQRNWIGRSSGIEIAFTLDEGQTLQVFTTRPDTLFGVTYLALAPQHPLVTPLLEKNPDLQQFINEYARTKTAEAAVATLEKKGIPLNIYAKHPLTQEQLPIWVTNFVLMDHGTGAIMAVPAHDQRDFEFAQKYYLPIHPVIIPSTASTTTDAENSPVLTPFTEEGLLVHSQQFTGLNTKAARDAISTYLVTHRLGEKKVYYRLRDWSISRQRYWGTPIPMIECVHCGTVPVPKEHLPILLPKQITFEKAATTLASLPEFGKTVCPSCQNPAQRETDTFDTFIESAWYYARFACKKQNKAMLDSRVNYWMPVDQYVGGIEHAVLHLLYARFFHKLLRDAGLINANEPFTRLLSQGMVLNKGAKMSKSRGNVVAPMPLLERYGADAMRLFVMFAAPPEQNLEWSDSGIEGAGRFLKRIWTYAYQHRKMIQKINYTECTNTTVSIDWEKATGQQQTSLRKLYALVSQIQHDFEIQQFNTVISGCMKLLNLLNQCPSTPLNEAIHEETRSQFIYQGMSFLLRLLAPIAPHITHQLWEELHYPEVIFRASWPKVDMATLPPEETLALCVQINGKLRSRLQAIPANANLQTIEILALQDLCVQNNLKNKIVKKIIWVPGKLINIVTQT